MDAFLHKMRLHLRGVSSLREQGLLTRLTRQDIVELLAEGAKAICEKDWAALNQVFATGAEFSVWAAGEPKKKIPWNRVDYLSSVATENITYETYEIELLSVLKESAVAWDIECAASAVAADGYSFKTRHRAMVELVDGHAQLTCIEFNLEGAR